MLQVAIASPNDLAALDDLRFASGCQIQTFVALEDEIAAAVDRSLPGACSKGHRGRVRAGRAGRGRDRPRIVRSGGAMSRQAVGRRNSDYQVSEEGVDEATEGRRSERLNRLLVRAAALGAEATSIWSGRPTTCACAFAWMARSTISAASRAEDRAGRCARLKVLGRHGHRRATAWAAASSVTIGQRHLDFRARPSDDPWRKLVRACDQSSLKSNWRCSACSPSSRIFAKSSTGPKGAQAPSRGRRAAARTSTLYAALRELVEAGRNITTIENPVEMQAGRDQPRAINEKRDFTFAKRAARRAPPGPDIIMVGEVRDGGPRRRPSRA